MSARGPVLAVVVALSSTWLVGCGGGGDEAVDPAASSPSPSSTSTTPSPSPDEPDGPPVTIELRVVLATSEASAADSRILQQLRGLDCDAPPTPAAPTAELVTCDDAGVGYVLEPAALVAEVESAEAAPGPVGDLWSVALQLAPDDATALGEVTSGLVRTGTRLAVVLDSRVLSAPTVEGTIRGGGLVVAGDYDEQQATDIAQRLGGAG